jgi:hypothetical protein
LRTTGKNAPASGVLDPSGWGWAVSKDPFALRQADGSAAFQGAERLDQAAKCPETAIRLTISASSLLLRKNRVI